MEITDDMYKIGTKKGILDKLYSRNQISPVSVAFLVLGDIPQNGTTLRGLNKEISMFGGQGHTKCNCKTSCMTNRCQCKKSGVLCNSKCHNSLSCNNK